MKKSRVSLNHQESPSTTRIAIRRGRRCLLIPRKRKPGSATRAVETRKANEQAANADPSVAAKGPARLFRRGLAASRGRTGGDRNDGARSREPSNRERTLLHGLTYRSEERRLRGAGGRLRPSDGASARGVRGRNRCAVAVGRNCGPRLLCTGAM